MPTVIPSQTFVCLSPSYSWARHTRRSLSRRQEGSDRLACPCSYCAARCCLRPRSGRLVLVFSVLASFACVLHNGFGPP